MSTFSCPVVRVRLEKHPNADTLSIAVVKGWNCVVRTEDFANDELGVYLPIDSVADKHHFLLSFLEGKKLKTKKLRGVISQGVLLPYSVVLKYLKKEHPALIHRYNEGDDLASLLGIKKWEEPEKPVNLKSSSQYPHVLAVRPEWLSKYTDIENWNNFPDVILDGEEVCITEKLHGTSAIFALVDGEFYVCSRNRCLRNKDKIIKIYPKWAKNIPIIRDIFSKNKVIPPENNVWNNYFLNRPEIKDSLILLASILHTERVAIYGEIVGVQDIKYGLKDGAVDFYAYDIRVSNEDGPEYLSPTVFQRVCEHLPLKICPVLYVGPFKKECLNLRGGKTTISGADHIREGIVIEPTEPRCVMNLGRVILKRVSEEYLMRKGDTDY